jgi:hypothetical protein
MVPPKKYKYFYTWNNEQFVDEGAYADGRKG